MFLLPVSIPIWKIHEAISSLSEEEEAGGGHNGPITAGRFLEDAMAEGIPIPADLRKRIGIPADMIAGG